MCAIGAHCLWGCKLTSLEMDHNQIKSLNPISYENGKRKHKSVIKSFCTEKELKSRLGKFEVRKDVNVSCQIMKWTELSYNEIIFSAILNKSGYKPCENSRKSKIILATLFYSLLIAKIHKYCCSSKTNKLNLMKSFLLMKQQTTKTFQQISLKF